MLIAQDREGAIYGIFAPRISVSEAAGLCNESKWNV
jgi:hypothetical protein